MHKKYAETKTQPVTSHKLLQKVQTECYSQFCMLFKPGYQTFNILLHKNCRLGSPTYKFYESQLEAMYRIGWYLCYQDLLLTDLTQGHWELDKKWPPHRIIAKDEC